MITMQQYCVPITKSSEFHPNDNHHIYDLHFLIDPSMESRKRKLTKDFTDEIRPNNSSTSGDSYDDVLSPVKPTKKRKILGFEGCEKEKLCKKYVTKKENLKKDKLVQNFSTLRSFSPSSSFLQFNPLQNSTCRNYELRPRTFLRRPTYRRDSVDEDYPSVDVLSKRKEKSAQRLSKYRRRTANARERHRMKEINDAFKSLREVLPEPIKMKESNLTKITTLRLAVDYIQALDDLLRDPDLNLRDTSYEIQGSIKECSNSLQLPPAAQSNSSFPSDSFSELIFGISPASSPFSESLHESSLLSVTQSTPAQPVPSHPVPVHPMPDPLVPTLPLPSNPKNKDFKVGNVNNYSFNFDDEALFPYEEDASTIESIAILLSNELDDDVF